MAIDCDSLQNKHRSVISSVNFNVIVRKIHIHIPFIDPVLYYCMNSHNAVAINANKYS